MNAALELATGERLALDEHGHLADWQAWTPAVAEAFARTDQLELSPGHWAVLEVFRAYYGDYETAPPMRALARILQQRSDNAPLGSRELYRLFPEGPLRQASRYAGLPLPVSCI